MPVLRRVELGRMFDLKLDLTTLQTAAGDIGYLDLHQFAAALTMRGIGQVQSLAIADAMRLRERLQRRRIKISIRKILLIIIGGQERVELSERYGILDEVFVHEIPKLLGFVNGRG